MNDSLTQVLIDKVDTLSLQVSTLSGTLWTMAGILVAAVFIPLLIKYTFGGR